jgi:hypothetical protein
MPTEDALEAMQALASETGLDLSDEAIAGSTTLAPDEGTQAEPQAPDRSPGQAPDRGPGQAPANPERPEAAGGEREARQQAQIAEQQPQPTLHQVPLATYLAEREEKQELRRRLEAFERARRPAEEPDPFLDPKGFVTANAAALLDSRLNQQVSPVLRQLQMAIAHNNKAAAAAMHSADLVERAQTEFDRAMPRMDPAECGRVMGAPNPFLAAVDWLRQKDFLAEVGGDPKAYRERLLAEALADPEFLGRAIEAARPGAAARQGQPQPTARASALGTAMLPSVNRSGSGAGSAAVRHDETDQELVNWATSRKSARPE